MKTVLLLPLLLFTAPTTDDERPSILFAIADDWAFPHAGAYGDPVVKTPTFDKVAKEGILFTHAFSASPSCTPSRAAILTGQYIHRLENSGNLRAHPRVRLERSRLIDSRVCLCRSNSLRTDKDQRQNYKCCFCDPRNEHSIFHTPSRCRPDLTPDPAPYLAHGRHALLQPGWLQGFSPESEHAAVEAQNSFSRDALWGLIVFG